VVISIRSSLWIIVFGTIDMGIDRPRLHSIRRVRDENLFTGFT
jgi:hypothetical protein